MAGISLLPTSMWTISHAHGPEANSPLPWSPAAPATMFTMLPVSMPITMGPEIPWEKDRRHTGVPGTDPTPGILATIQREPIPSPGSNNSRGRRRDPGIRRRPPILPPDSGGRDTTWPNGTEKIGPHPVPDGDHMQPLHDLPQAPGDLAATCQTSPPVHQLTSTPVDLFTSTPVHQDTRATTTPRPNQNGPQAQESSSTTGHCQHHQNRTQRAAELNYIIDTTPERASDLERILTQAGFEFASGPDQRPSQVPKEQPATAPGPTAVQILSTTLSQLYEQASGDVQAPGEFEDEAIAALKQDWDFIPSLKHLMDNYCLPEHLDTAIWNEAQELADKLRQTMTATSRRELMAILLQAE